MAFGDGFASGFAQGFVRARERTEDRQAEQENTLFKYKMENLMQYKTKREKKKEQETEYARQAKELAAQMGDPDFAPIAHQELRNGVGYETLQKRMQDGSYQTNPDYKTPERVVKVPSAVSEPLNTNPSAPINMSATPNNPVEVASIDPVAPVNAAPSTFNTPIGASIAAGKANRAAKMEEKVNKRIGEIDPSLLTQADEDDGDSTTLTAENSKYVFKPKNEMKVGDYVDVQYELDKAIESKDPVKIRDAQMKLDAHNKYLTAKSLSDARANGKNIQPYIEVNEDGTLGRQFAGEVQNGVLWDRNNPMDSNKKAPANFIRMDEDTLKRYNTLQDNFAKQSADYKIQGSAMVSAIDSAARLSDLLHKDKGAPTYTAKGLALAKQLGTELETGYSALWTIEQEIDSKIQKGDTEGLEGMIAAHARQADEFYKQALLSPTNNQRAKNAALYQTLKMSAAYNLAQANSGEGKLSDQDIRNSVNQITGGREEADSIQIGLASVTKAAYLKLRTQADAINSNEAIAGFERQLGGIKTGLRVDDLATMVKKSTYSKQEKDMLLQYIGGLEGQYQEDDTRNRINTAQQNPETQGAQADLSEEETGLPEVKSKEERDKLPPGTEYLIRDPNTNQMIKKRKK